jgi:hypothetical protein
MYCRICGDEANVRYYPRKRQALCRHCAKDTPAKVDRATFDKLYWGKDDVPESTKREFYADYLASTCGSVASYVDATMEPLDA